MILMHILLCFVYGVCLGSSPDPSSRIIDSTQTDITAYPYQVSLEYKMMFRCSGSILNEEWILTAAQCVKDINVNDLRARAGTRMRNVLGELHNISYTVPHPDFNATTLDSDIALLKVADNFTFGAKVRNITLSSDGPPEEANVTVTGWGALTYGTWFQHYLQETELPLADFQTCYNNYINISNIVTDNMICAGEEGRGTCQGDLGDPMVYNSTIVGISSWSYGCGEPHFPGVYTAAYKFYDWVDEIISATV